MKKSFIIPQLVLWIFIIFGALFQLFFSQSSSASRPSINLKLGAVYDHEFHEKKVFGKLKINCDRCHNFKVSSKNNIGVALPGLKKQTFKAPLKELCHSCHQSSEDKYSSAPKTCYTCHTSLNQLKAVKPSNHQAVSWESNHGLNAKLDSKSCTQCHSNSECVKCHAQRNNVRLKNHRFNFKYYHSVEARMSPQKCQTCHSKSECMQCHVGRSR